LRNGEIDGEIAYSYRKVYDIGLVFRKSLILSLHHVRLVHGFLEVRVRVRVRVRVAD